MRHTFCLWFINVLNLRTDFASSVIFSDEKWWVLDSAPNSQNRRHWALVSPREILERKYQGKKKSMCWVGVLKGTLKVGACGLCRMVQRATAERVLTWLHSKFGARIISRRSAICWPPQSPD